MSKTKRVKRGNAPNGKNRRKAHKKTIGTCLVLMPFKEPFDTYFLSIIQPAVKVALLQPVRGDSLFRPSPIMGDIWKMIQESRVLIADLTEKNANVFYELGLAHAIGKPVVLISDNLGDVPFDLQSLRVLIYDKNEPAWGSELKSSIAAALDETLRDTASAVPSMFRKPVKSQAPTESKTDMRLDLLEREVAALSVARRTIPGRNLSPDELYARMKRVNSPSEAIDVARNALASGISARLLASIVRGAMPPRDAKTILIALGLPAR